MTYNSSTVGIETGDGYNINVNTTDDNDLVLDILIPEWSLESDGGVKFHRLKMDFLPACEFLKGVGQAVDRMVLIKQVEANILANPTLYFPDAPTPTPPFPEESDEMLVEGELSPNIIIEQSIIRGPEAEARKRQWDEEDRIRWKVSHLKAKDLQTSEYAIFTAWILAMQWERKKAADVVAYPTEESSKRSEKSTLARISIELFLPWEDSNAAAI